MGDFSARYPISSPGTRTWRSKFSGTTSICTGHVEAESIHFIPIKQWLQTVCKYITCTIYNGQDGRFKVWGSAVAYGPLFSCFFVHLNPERIRSGEALIQYQNLVLQLVTLLSALPFALPSGHTSERCIHRNIRGIFEIPMSLIQLGQNSWVP